MIPSQFRVRSHWHCLSPLPLSLIQTSDYTEWGEQREGREEGGDDILLFPVLHDEVVLLRVHRARVRLHAEQLRIVAGSVVVVTGGLVVQ